MSMIPFTETIVLFSFFPADITGLSPTALSVMARLCQVRSAQLHSSFLVFSLEEYPALFVAL